MKRLLIAIIALSMLLVFGGTSLAGLNDGLVAYYPLNGDPYDASINGNDPTDISNISYINGVLGEAAYFSGDQAYLRFDERHDYPYRTVTFWIKVSSFDTPHKSRKALGTDGGDQYKQYGTFGAGTHNQDGVNTIRLAAGGADGTNAYEILNASLDQWYHAAMVLNGDNVHYYVDGIYKYSTYSTTVSSVSNQGYFKMGATRTLDQRRFFKGALDEVRIYNRALSECEIQELYSGRIDADQDGFTACEGDCNDNDSSIYPNAPELCDGIDNDCDDNVPSNEVDTDNDGYLACDDCNDENDAINKDAIEIPNNYVDENCDGDFGDCYPCDRWRNHGAYVRCVAHSIEEWCGLGVFTEVECDNLVNSAARSDIGKKGYIPPECE